MFCRKNIGGLYSRAKINQQQLDQSVMALVHSLQQRHTANMAYTFLALQQER